jgi:hypothetical protein
VIEKEVNKPDLSTEEAMKIDLDEQAKPTRKTSHNAPPLSYNEEPGRHHKKKGTKKIT